MDFKILAVPVAVLAIWAYFHNTSQTDNKMERTAAEIDLKTEINRKAFVEGFNGSAITPDPDSDKKIADAKEKLKKYDGRSEVIEKRQDAVTDVVNDDVQRALKAAK